MELSLAPDGPDPDEDQEDAWNDDGTRDGSGWDSGIWSSCFSRDELLKKFIAAINDKKLVMADVFLKEMRKVTLLANQGGEADRGIQSQLAGCRDLLAWEIQSVRMTDRRACRRP